MLFLQIWSFVFSWCVFYCNGFTSVSGKVWFRLFIGLAWFQFGMGLATLIWFGNTVLRELNPSGTSNQCLMNVMDECWQIHDRTKLAFIHTEIKNAHFNKSFFLLFFKSINQSFFSELYCSTYCGKPLLLFWGWTQCGLLIRCIELSKLNVGSTFPH